MGAVETLVAGRHMTSRKNEFVDGRRGPPQPAERACITRGWAGEECAFEPIRRALRTADPWV